MAYSNSNADLAFSREEIFGDGEGRGQSISIVRRSAPFLFGPASISKVKLERGLVDRANLHDASRLIAQGYSNGVIARRVHAGRRFLRVLRKILEVNSGRKFTCPCGRPAGHRDYCDRLPAIYPRHYKLTREKVLYIRKHYHILRNPATKLARELGLEAWQVRSALKGRSHKDLPGVVSKRKIWEPIKRRRGRIRRMILKCVPRLEIAKRLKVNRDTVTQVAMAMIREGITCPCGQRIGHRNRCLPTPKTPMKIPL